MPNGKPGDNPITDVVVWGKNVFEPRTDALIREIDAYTDDYAVYDPFDAIGDLLWEIEANRAREPELYEALVTLRERLRSERDHSRPGKGE